MRAQHQHGEQREVGRDAAEAGAERPVEVAGAQAFQHADRDGGDQGAGDAVDPAQDDDREDLQPDQRRRRGDVNVDSVADFPIQLNTAYILTAADFTLWPEARVALLAADDRRRNALTSPPPSYGGGREREGHTEGLHQFQI